MLTLQNSPGLAELLMHERADGAADDQFVKWAQDALEAGHDSPSLLRLAVQLDISTLRSVRYSCGKR